MEPSGSQVDGKLYTDNLLKPISAAIEFSHESVEIPAVLLAEGCENQLNSPLNKNEQIFLMIQLREKYLENICTQKDWLDKQIFSQQVKHAKKGENNFFMQPALHVECFWIKIERVYYICTRCGI